MDHISPLSWLASGRPKTLILVMNCKSKVQAKNLLDSISDSKLRIVLKL